MKTPEIPVNEVERQKALREYEILDTIEDPEYDSYTKLAAEICNTPISCISFIDENRQWFKSHHGLDINETSRDVAFCAHAINEPYEVFYVEEASKNPDFADNPLVNDGIKIDSYLGVPLTTPEGFALGTLCVIDFKPLNLSEEKISALKLLAQQLVKLLELRKKNLIHERKHQEKIEEVNHLAYTLAHDIRTPLTNIDQIIHILINEHSFQLDADGIKCVNFLSKISNNLNNFVSEILEFYVNKAEHSELTTFDLRDLLNEIIDCIDFDKKVKFIIDEIPETITSSKIAKHQIFLNLIQNAIKFNFKDSPEVHISCHEDEAYYYFEVSDNGNGIEKSEFEKVFTVFKSSKKRDRFGKKGNGIGLANVKKLVEFLGGQIYIKSSSEEGTTFSFSIKKVLRAES
jgi:signal transduction histidine kinase